MTCEYCGLPEEHCKATIKTIHGLDIGIEFPSLHRDAGYKTISLNPMIGVSAINRYVGKREPSQR